jgi:choline dehydrogenase
MLPYLRRSERAAGRDPVYRGIDGPMVVAPAPARHPLMDDLFASALAAGHRESADLNGAADEGVGWCESNVIDGRRQSAADGYLVPAFGRDNLTVVPAALVLSLLIEHGRCVGVRYRGYDGEQVVRCQREVVLAGGTIGSAQLLLCSGIGPAAQLRELGVEPLVDLPGVGANLHDHPLCVLTFASRRPMPGGAFVRKPNVRFRSKPNAEPDLQMIFQNAPIRLRWTAEAIDGFTVTFSLQTPRSRGSLRLISPDPTVAPRIDPNYLAEPDDVAAMVIALRAARRLAGSSPHPGGHEHLLPSGWDLPTGGRPRGGGRPRSTRARHRGIACC